jgi:hypothetical protein
MLKIFFASVAALSLLSAASTISRAEVYELRTYTSNPGKLDALNARFRDHTLKLFEKHGIENVGYWVPTDDEKSKNTLIYVIKHTSREAAKKSWAAFMADPQWQEAYKKSEIDGKLASKVESVFMETTDYSPEMVSRQANSTGVYELRIYKTNEDKLEGLNSRFRDHTLRLFERHGIQNVAYWTPTDGPASSNTLIYLIRHQSPERALESWKAFAADEEWKKVAEESQKDGRFLSEKPQAIYMKATDYSPMH